MSANRLSSRINCVLAYKSSAMPRSRMVFCAGCISGPSASMRSRMDWLMGSGVITVVIVWPPFVWLPFVGLPFVGRRFRG